MIDPRPFVPQRQNCVEQFVIQFTPTLLHEFAGQRTATIVCSIESDIRINIVIEYIGAI